VYVTTNHILTLARRPCIQLKKYNKNSLLDKFINYKIVVPTEVDKLELQKCFKYLHNLKDLSTKYIVVNQLVHEYLDNNNIIVDSEIYEHLKK